MGTGRVIDAAVGHARNGRQGVRLAHGARRRSPCLLALVLSCSLAGVRGPGASLCSADADFRRGDANGDGPIDIADAVATLGFLFQGGTLVTCLDAADANDDGEVNLTDAVDALGMLFLGTPAPPGPGPVDCGPDPTADAIGCDSYALCPGGGPGNVSLELAAAAGATIGPAGGTLETRDADGTRYRLTIPEDAIAVGTRITMTPVAAIAGYPLADGVVAGVDFAPAGLVLAAPALLTIETAKTPPAGTTAVALTYEGDAETYAQAILGQVGGALALPIEHFSGGTVGFATEAELQALQGAASAPCLLPAQAAAGATPPDLATLFSVYRGCFTSLVLPAIGAASNDEELATATGLLALWQIVSREVLGIDLFATFDDAGERLQAQEALAPRLREAIARNNDRCEADQSFAALANVLFWQRQAERFGVATSSNLLERGQILLGLCARAVVESVVLVDEPQVGFPHSLDLRFGMRFEGQAETQGAAFRVQIAEDGLDVQNPTGFTNLQGEYTTVVTATREGPVSLTATACLVLPGTTQATDVCVSEEVIRNGEDLTGVWGGGMLVTKQDGIVVERTPLDCKLTLDQNQNAVRGRFNFCPDDTGFSLPFAATLSERQLLNLSIGADADCLLEGSGTVSGSTLTLSVSGPCEGGVIEATLQLERDAAKC